VQQGSISGRFLCHVLHQNWVLQTLLVGVLVLICAGMGNTVHRQFPLVSQMHAFAEQWDRRDAEIKQAQEDGKQQVALPSLSHLSGLAELDEDPKYWINGCVAQLYGFSEVGVR